MGGRTTGPCGFGKEKREEFQRFGGLRQRGETILIVTPDRMQKGENPVCRRAITNSPDKARYAKKGNRWTLQGRGGKTTEAAREDVGGKKQKKCGRKEKKEIQWKKRTGDTAPSQLKTTEHEGINRKKTEKPLKNLKKHVPSKGSKAAVMTKGRENRGGP